MEYKEKEVSALADRITNFIAEEFGNTEYLGPANHFMAFADVYCAVLTLFYGAVKDEEGYQEMLNILHEEEENAKRIHKIMMQEKKKLN